ncbi:hypothetical protein [Paenibacillus hexagrammi]|uniref:Uncharacterized protein n=1 Tax=Paenibacillus hexagrammi TaxID=2908839 RepID=A0ABY3SI99_9BACL|nr:hypothetical protein [Paenibacillus sp. YPD9-1]UJF33772.1 hypothetical protein L0M14_00430 [Paenibacillus sp. YPD9-1]
MKAEITRILNDVNSFTDIWVKSDLRNNDFKIIDIPNRNLPRGDGIETLTLMLCPNVFSSTEEAFATMLKKFIYYNEEWADDQYGGTIESWFDPLRTFWLPEYIKQNTFEVLPSDEFVDSLRKDLVRICNKNNEILFTSIPEVLNDLNVIGFNKGLLCQDAFGISTEICFFYSWWIGY